MKSTTLKIDGKAGSAAAFANPNNPTWTKNIPPGIRQNKANKLWFFNKNICGRYVCECVSRLATDRETVTQIAEARVVELRKVYQGNSAVAAEPGKVTFADAVNRYKELLGAQVAKSERDGKTQKRSLDYLESIVQTWAEKHGQNLLEINPKKVLPREVEDWHTYFKTSAVPRNQKSRGRKGYSGSVTNKTVSVFRRLFEIVIEEFNPSVTNLPAKLSWISVQEEDTELPSDEKWEEVKKLLRSTDRRNNQWTPQAADLIEGLEFTGCRLTELTLFEKSWINLNTWSITIPSLAVKGRLGKKQGRTIGIIPQARALFTRLVADADPKTGEIFKVKKAYRTLQRACRDVGISNLSHHDIRKLFTTRCIEAGIAPAVVGKWLGHRDGGKLALRVYTRVRPEALALLTNSLVFGKVEARPEDVKATAVSLAASLSSAELLALAKQLQQAARAQALPANVVPLSEVA